MEEDVGKLRSKKAPPRAGVAGQNAGLHNHALEKFPATGVVGWVQQVAHDISGGQPDRNRQNDPNRVAPGSMRRDLGSTRGDKSRQWMRQWMRQRGRDQRGCEAKS